jgi:molybdenum cofactor cytidylyltransferase
MEVARSMRMLSLSPDRAPAELPSQAVVCHDVRNPLQRGEILARKGTALAADELRHLLDRGIVEIHLALPEPGDVSEDEATNRMASAIAGRGVRFEEAHFGQSSLISLERGMLRVAGACLDRVNALDGVLLLTGEADRPVDADTTLGVVKCAPLFLSESSLRGVDDIVQANRPIVEIEPFQTLRVAFVAPAERLRGGAFDRARAALSDAVSWYGSELDQVVGAEASVGALAGAYAEVQQGGADLVLAAGASGTDPLDVVFEGLREAGGEVLQLGIPAEPGTACWIGRLGNMPVLGLASCELFGQPGALDLLLPRLLTGDALDQELLRRLALGGLLLGPSRIAPYHTPRVPATGG